jgi:hypothetical protein
MGTLSKSVALKKSVQFGKGLAPNSKCRQLFVLAKWWSIDTHGQ